MHDLRSYRRIGAIWLRQLAGAEQRENRSPVNAARIKSERLQARIERSEIYHICPNKDCRRLIERREQSHGNIDIPCCKWCGQALEWTKGDENNDS